MKSKEIYKGQRTKEKQMLFSCFVFPAIEELFKNKFYALYDHKCFKCGVKGRAYKSAGNLPTLCMDHHIPMALGGHLVPGNLVALCRICNNKKLDLPPEKFYTSEELKKLQPILDNQASIFEFKFDWDFWKRDREAYLLHLGVDPAIVQNLLYNPEHIDFIGFPKQEVGVSISIDLDELLKNIENKAV